jgi:hypothetical protein
MRTAIGGGIHIFKNSPVAERREGLEERRPVRRSLIRGLEDIGNVDRRVGNYERRFGVSFFAGRY